MPVFPAKTGMFIAGTSAEYFPRQIQGYTLQNVLANFGGYHQPWLIVTLDMLVIWLLADTN